MTLPIFDHPTSLPRVRALLSLKALPTITGDPRPAHSRAAGELRTYGLDEVVVFERRYQRSSGSSIAFTYSRGERIALR